MLIFAPVLLIEDSLGIICHGRVKTTLVESPVALKDKSNIGNGHHFYFTFRLPGSVFI